MDNTRWTTKDLVVIGLGASLVVFFAGVAVAITAGHTPPTEMWAAGSAVSGGLIGLLVGPPRSKKAVEAVVKAEAAGAAPPPANPAAAEPPAAPAVAARSADAILAAMSKNSSFAAAMVLLVFFLGLLTLGVVLAAGIIVPLKEFVQSLQSVTTAVISLAAASGSALVGLLAPSPAQH
jgi:hypothetical protein